MKQNQITKVYGALKEFSALRLPVHIAYQVFSIMKTIESYYQCGVEMERKLIEQHGGVPGNGESISFPSVDEATKFRDALVELGELDVEIDIKPIRVTKSQLGDQTIRVQTMMNLDGVIVFEDA